MLGRARVLVRMSYDGSRATWRIRKGTGRMTVAVSVFCSVREPVPLPLCRYYASAVQRMLARFDIETAVTVDSCQGAGGAACTMLIPFVSVEPAEPVEPS